MQTVGLMTGNPIGGGLMVMLTGALGRSPAVLVLAATVALTLPAIALLPQNPEHALARSVDAGCAGVLPPAAQDPLVDRRRCCRSGRR